MPLINGCKYSCESCIRGHRATTCSHTDRALIEVRKPGRPLQSCGHRLDSCNCGRLAEIFTMGHGLPEVSNMQITAKPLSNIVTSTMESPSTSGRSRPVKKARARSKVIETSRRKSDSRPIVPAWTTSSLGYSNSHHHDQVLCSPSLPRIAQLPSPPVSCKHSSHFSLQYTTSPDPTVQHLSSPHSSNYIHSQSPERLVNSGQFPIPQPPNFPPRVPNYSSRVEDLLLPPIVNIQQGA